MAEEWPSYGPEKKSRPKKSAQRPPVVMSGAGEITHFVVTKSEAQRVLAWFGQAASVAPGDFELAARIRRAFE